MAVKKNMDFGGGAWMAQKVKHPTPDLSSGRDLEVREIEPRVGLCADSAVTAWDSLSPSLSLSKQIKINLKKKGGGMDFGTTPPVFKSHLCHLVDVSPRGNHNNLLVPQFPSL